MQENNIQENNQNSTPSAEEHIRSRKALQRRALETICYVYGAGAFGVFFRWLQVMTAFNEDGLVNRSVFNLLVPALLIASLIIFNNFVRKISKDRLYVPKAFCDALFNPGKIFTVIRWAAAAIMCAGALLLFISTETDKNVDMLRILAGVGFLAGISYPLYMGEANYEDIEHPGLIRLYGLAPVALYAVWLIVCYKENIYNSVIWDYIIEMATIIVVMLAFFFVSGFSFYVVNGRNTLFFCMLGAAMCVTALADSRYLGEQMMLLATAVMLGADTWIIITNLKKKKPRPKSMETQDGFELL